jgi:hypothetical protein
MTAHSPECVQAKDALDRARVGYERDWKDYNRVGDAYVHAMGYERDWNAYIRARDAYDLARDAYDLARATCPACREVRA